MIQLINRRRLGIGWSKIMKAAEGWWQLTCQFINYLWMDGYYINIIYLRNILPMR